MTTTSNLITQCTWPTLASPYGEALREAVAFVLEYVPDTLGIIVSGTIIRGTPAASSDLDIYVIRRQAQRQRIQRRFRTVPAEIFINPPAKVREYFVAEREALRPITAHMLATGFTVLARDPVVTVLRHEAQTALDTPPAISPQRLVQARYMAATRLEDAIDMVTTRPETAKMILCLAVHDMLQYRFMKVGAYLPRDKDLISALESLDPPLAALAQTFWGGCPLDVALGLAQSMADLTLETYGFFEWSSETEDVSMENVSTESTSTEADSKVDA